MSTPITPTPPPPGLGEPTPQCPNCGAALARDQRYCLNCGQRLTEPRVDFHEALGLKPAPPPPPPRNRSWNERNALITLAAIAAVVVALGVGVVIGRGNGGSNSAAKPTVVTVAGGGSAQPDRVVGGSVLGHADGHRQGGLAERQVRLDRGALLPREVERRGQ